MNFKSRMIRRVPFLLAIFLCVIFASRFASADEQSNLFNVLLNKEQVSNALNAYLRFDGEGIVWENDCPSDDKCYSNGEQVFFNGTISITIKNFEVFWDVELEIDDMGISESFSIGSEDGSIEIDDSGRFVKFESRLVLDDASPLLQMSEQPEDFENPEKKQTSGESGNMDFSLVIKLDNSAGFINTRKESRDDKTNKSYGWELIGSANLSK